MWDPYAEFMGELLPNGMSLYASEWKGRPWEAIGILVHTGSRNDPEGLEGMAHFIEHLVSANSYCPRSNIRTLLGNNGGTINFGCTGYSRTEYSFFAPLNRDVLMEVLDFLGHMLLLARLERSIDKEREIIVEEFNLHYRPRYKYEMEMRERQGLYSGYWQERSVRPLGTPQSIAAIYGELLQRHYDTHYVPANISLVGVGGLNLEELFEMVSRSKLARGKDGTRTVPDQPVCEVKPLVRNIYEFCGADIMPGLVSGAYRSVAKLPGNLADQFVLLAASVLSDVLTEEVRERRAWTYDIGCHVDNLGNFVEFSVNCSSVTAKAINDIHAVVNACMELAGTREDLLEQNRRRIKAKRLMIDPTARGVRDDVMNDLSLWDRIVTLEECNAELDRATMADIRGIYAMLRPEMRYTHIMRP